MISLSLNTTPEIIEACRARMVLTNAEFFDFEDDVNQIVRIFEHCLDKFSHIALVNPVLNS